MKIVLIVAIDEHYLLQRSPISFFDNVAVAVDRAHSTRTCAPQDFLLALRLLSLGARKLFPWATIVVARAENFISRLKLFLSWEKKVAAGLVTVLFHLLLFHLSPLRSLLLCSRILKSASLFRIICVFSRIMDKVFFLKR